MVQPVRTVPLPRRQLQVASLVSEGRSNKEIAAQLGISVHTVRHTLSVIFQKLEVVNRAGVAYAVATGRVAAGNDRSRQ
ncbi:MAG: response regulator transcription factor [Vicinamibacterales bacterium]